MFRCGHIWLLGLALQAPGISAAPVDSEVIEKLETNGLFFSSGAVPHFSTIEAFKVYLIDKDPYADFLTRDEYLQFKNAQGERYAGIGLEIERDRSGAVLCFPDPAGPAANAGVSAGDALVAIDGRPVQRLPLPTLVAWAAGTAGSEIVIDVATQNKGARRITIVRRSVTGPSVTDRNYGVSKVVRIASFTPNTRQELAFILSTRHSPAPLIVDLRGNRGGDLNAAIDSAMLFLKRGAVVASVREKKVIHRYVSTLEQPLYPGASFLWQDSGTASSAELFIAALTDNGRAVSVGQKTFGKGTKQDLFELGSGAVLIVTTGYLLTPGGKEIEGRGLAPGAEVTGAATDQAYLDAVTRLSAGHH
jgi:carboxyl-terminal processing protease